MKPTNDRIKYLKSQLTRVDLFRKAAVSDSLCMSVYKQNAVEYRHTGLTVKSYIMALIQDKEAIQSELNRTRRVI